MWENSGPHLTTAIHETGRRAGFRCSKSEEQPLRRNSPERAGDSQWAKRAEPLALTTTGFWTVCRYPLAGNPPTSGVGNAPEFTEKRHQRVSSSIRGFADLPGNLRLHGKGPQVTASPFDRFRDDVVRQLGALSVGDHDVIVPEGLGGWLDWDVVVEAVAKQR